LNYAINLLIINILIYRTSLNFFEHYLVDVPICIRVTVKNIVNVLVAPTFYILCVGSVVVFIRSFVLIERIVVIFFITILSHVLCFFLVLSY